MMYSNSDHIDKLLVDLKVLSRIPDGGRIATRSNNCIEIEKHTWYTSMIRWLRGDNRNDAYSTIKSTINDAISICKYGIKTYSKTDPSSPEILDILLRIDYELRTAIDGIENLKNTYNIADDLSIVAKFDVVIENAKKQIQELNEFLKKNNVPFIHFDSNSNNSKNEKQNEKQSKV